MLIQKLANDVALQGKSIEHRHIHHCSELRERAQVFTKREDIDQFNTLFQIKRKYTHIHEFSELKGRTHTFMILL